MNRREMKGLLFIASGVVLLLWFVLGNHLSCCAFESKYTPTGRDGGAILLILAIAAAAVAYGAGEMQIGRGERAEKPPRELSKRRRTLLLVLIFAAFFLFVLLMPSGLSRYQASEESECKAKCSETKRFARLVPLVENMPARSGAFRGPWRCECY